MEYFRGFGALILHQIASVLRCMHLRLAGGKVRTMREYYIIVNNKWVYVTREVWQAHNAYVNHIHYEANRDRKRKQCWAGRKQMAACTGDCHTCRYYAPKEVSVDVLYERNDSRIGGHRYQDPQMLLRCVETVADMARVDPAYGERIGRMIMDGWDIVDIAVVLDIPVSTLRDRLRRIGRMIRGG